MMRTMRYTGSDPKLTGKTALVMPYEGGVVLAQFDDTTLPEAFSWGKFRERDFEELPDVQDDVA